MTETQYTDTRPDSDSGTTTDSNTTAETETDAPDLAHYVQYGASWLVHLHIECEGETADGRECSFDARAVRLTLHDDGGIEIDGRCGHHIPETWSPGEQTAFDGFTVVDIDWRAQTCEKSMRTADRASSIPSPGDGPSVVMSGEARVTCDNRSRVAVIAANPDGSYATKVLCLHHLRNVWVSALERDTTDDDGGDA